MGLAGDALADESLSCSGGTDQNENLHFEVRYFQNQLKTVRAGLCEALAVAIACKSIVKVAHLIWAFGVLYNHLQRKKRQETAPGVQGTCQRTPSPQGIQMNFMTSNDNQIETFGGSYDKILDLFVLELHELATVSEQRQPQTGAVRTLKDHHNDTSVKTTRLS